MTDYIVGLDIGTTKIAVVVGRRAESGKIEIAGYGKTESLGVKRGFVSNIELTIQSIQKAVKEAEENSNVEIKEVFVGIAGQYVKSIQQRGHYMKQVRDEEISQDDIDKLTASMYNLAINPGEQIIAVIPQEYTIDGEPGIKEPVGMVGTLIETNFHVITAQIAAVRNIKKCVERAGLELKGLILEPIASSSAAVSEEEKEAGVALVDIGGGTTDIAIFQDGFLRHSSVIPFGGEVITEDIKEGCTIIKKYAEDLKVKFGSAMAVKTKEEEIVSIPGLRGRPPKEISLKNLASIIQARMEEILEQVNFNIRNSGYEKKLIAGIIITGGGSLLKNIIQLTEYVTGKETRIGYPNEFLENGTDKELSNPIYSTAVGLLKIGIEKAEEDELEATQSDKDKTEEELKPEVKEVKKKRRHLLDMFESFLTSE